MNRRLLLVLSLVSVLALTAAGPVQAALNALFIRWVRLPHVVHIIVTQDDGRPNQPPARVGRGQPVLMGFEWAGETVEELQANIIANSGHDITVSVDGRDPFSVKRFYQDAFLAVPGQGPRWSWDHDGDGLGDGNGNGIPDWDGPILFFRFPYPGLGRGTHTFDFH